LHIRQTEEQDVAELPLVVMFQHFVSSDVASLGVGTGTKTCPVATTATAPQLPSQV
jgi:hypothetical protein